MEFTRALHLLKCGHQLRIKSWDTDTFITMDARDFDKIWLSRGGSDPYPINKLEVELLLSEEWELLE